MKLLLVAMVSATAFMMQPAAGVILFGLGNSANLTDPGTGVQFDSVGLLANNDMSAPQGSAIHLGGGYMLTANHVGMRPYVTFDGSTFYQRDLAFSPVQVAPNVDMKVFKLTSTPTVAAANLYAGSGEQIASATLIGWGKGRNPTVPLNSVSVAWGGDDTIDKRWGLNVPKGLINIGYQSGSYTGIYTVLGSDAGSPSGLGANEAAATLFDSGSGLFQNIAGTWYLIGLTTSVDTFDSSNFGNDQPSDPNGDRNYFVRVSAYRGAIINAIPETSAMALFFISVPLLLRRRC